VAQANGSTFEGMWVHGRKHGSGCYMWATGALYDGEWQEGAMQGFGRCVTLPTPTASTQSVVQRVDTAHTHGFRMALPDHLPAAFT